jgi:FkbM family methyltransferase
VQISITTVFTQVEVLRKFVGTKKTLTTSSLTNSVLAVWRPGLIKIDVDGAEFDALQSGRSLFSERKANVLIETHSQAVALRYTCNC